MVDLSVNLMPNGPMAGGHVFGCYAAEPWRVHTRFYGSGETSGEIIVIAGYLFQMIMSLSDNHSRGSAMASFLHVTMMPEPRS